MTFSSPISKRRSIGDHSQSDVWTPTKSMSDRELRFFHSGCGSSNDETFSIRRHSISIGQQASSTLHRVKSSLHYEVPSDRSVDLKQYSPSAIDHYSRAFHKDEKLMEKLAKRVRDRVEHDCSGLVSFYERRMKKKKYQAQKDNNGAHSPIVECIDAENIVLGACLGQGSFSSVFVLERYLVRSDRNRKTSKQARKKCQKAISGPPLSKSAKSNRDGQVTDASDSPPIHQSGGRCLSTNTSPRRSRRSSRNVTKRDKTGEESDDDGPRRRSGSRSLSRTGQPRRGRRPSMNHSSKSLCSNDDLGDDDTETYRTSSRSINSEKQNHNEAPRLVGDSYTIPLAEKTHKDDISFAGTATTASMSTHSSFSLGFEDGDSAPLTRNLSGSEQECCSRSWDSRIRHEDVVVKILQPKLMKQPKLFANCAAGLIREGLFLAALDHPHVLKVHAWSSPEAWKDFPALSRVDGKLYDGYILFLERLEGGTLKRWMQRWNLENEEDRLAHAAVEAVETANRVMLEDFNSPSSSMSTSRRSASRLRRALFGSSKKKCNEEKSESGTNILEDDQHPYPRRLPRSKLSDRIHLLLQLSDTVKYLQKHRILHRDLKPDNLGVTFVKPDPCTQDMPTSSLSLKIFDFDIARLVPKPPEDTVDGDGNSTQLTRSPSMSRRTRPSISFSPQCDALFKMTGNMGSPRYMAPEIARREVYNLKSEVYTVALLVHELLTLQRPYDELEPEDHSQLVHKNIPGYRPPIRETWNWPFELKQILIRGWGDIRQRPSIKEFNSIIKRTLPQLLVEVDPAAIEEQNVSTSTSKPKLSGAPKTQETSAKLEISVEKSPKPLSIKKPRSLFSRKKKRDASPAPTSPSHSQSSTSQDCNLIVTDE